MNGKLDVRFTHSEEEVVDVLTKPRSENIPFPLETKLMVFPSP